MNEKLGIPGLGEPVLGIVSVIQIGEGRLTLEEGLRIAEEGLRTVWRAYYSDRLTVEQRKEELSLLLDSYPREVLEALTSPVGPEGKTRLMQIATEEVSNAQLRKTSQEPAKRPSKGMRKHIRREKAEVRREGKLPPRL